MDTREHIRLFRTNLVNFRKKNNYTQQNLAEKCHISIRKYQRLEAGETTPSFEDLIVLSKSLNLNIDKLLRYDGEIADYQTLTPELLEQSESGNQLKEFIHSINTDELSTCSNSFQIFNLIIQSPEFSQSPLPLVVSELTLCTLNPAAADFLGETPMKKISFAALTSQRMELVGLMNSLIRQDEYYLYFDLQLAKPTPSGKVSVGCVNYFKKIGTSFWAISILDK